MHQSAPSPADEAALIDPVEMMVGRRAAPRVPVKVLARFRAGDLAADVLVNDISVAGARLELSGPPPAGTAGMLLWEDIVCRCRVVWSGPEAFGIMFDQPEQVPLPAEKAKLPQGADADCALFARGTSVAAADV
uniref:PilZ domain-containing protein n=1 Tax=uncultured bacterium 5H7 TaxID=1701327 RepID=A0A0N9HTM7_9BACT|nr:hypothetical protein 5H7_046 [uncultured bacterium 5H7]